MLSMCSRTCLSAQYTCHDPAVVASQVVNVMSGLNPVVVVNGRNLSDVLEAYGIGIPLSEIGAEIADLSSRSDDITRP